MSSLDDLMILMMMMSSSTWTSNVVIGNDVFENLITVHIVYDQCCLLHLFRIIRHCCSEVLMMMMMVMKIVALLIFDWYYSTKSWEGRSLFVSDLYFDLVCSVQMCCAVVAVVVVTDKLTYLSLFGCLHWTFFLWCGFKVCKVNTVLRFFKQFSSEGGHIRCQCLLPISEFPIY